MIPNSPRCWGFGFGDVACLFSKMGKSFSNLTEGFLFLFIIIFVVCLLLAFFLFSSQVEKVRVVKVPVCNR